MKILHMFIEKVYSNNDDLQAIRTGILQELEGADQGNNGINAKERNGRGGRHDTVGVQGMAEKE